MRHFSRLFEEFLAPLPDPFFNGISPPQNNYPFHDTISTALNFPTAIPNVSTEVPAANSGADIFPATIAAQSGAHPAAIPAAISVQAPADDAATNIIPAASKTLSAVESAAEPVALSVKIPPPLIPVVLNISAKNFPINCPGMFHPENITNSIHRFIARYNVSGYYNGTVLHSGTYYNGTHLYNTTDWYINDTRLYIDSRLWGNGTSLYVNGTYHKVPRDRPVSYFPRNIRRILT